jgi:hypothetical protein
MECTVDGLLVGCPGGKVRREALADGAILTFSIGPAKVIAAVDRDGNTVVKPGVAYRSYRVSRSAVPPIKTARPEGRSLSNYTAFVSEYLSTVPDCTLTEAAALWSRSLSRHQKSTLTPRELVEIAKAMKL